MSRFFAGMRLVALTFVGGALGSAARFSLGLVWDPFWSLIVINLVGAAMLGWLVNSKRFESADAKAFLGTGFAGGFTSMSAVALFFVQTSLLETTVWSTLILIAHLPAGVAAYLLVKKATA
ncbi:MAG: CrcB family protein [Actinomycetales bacterium]|nr:CrcB family protein [Actinomycetales bacterium]